MKVNLIVLLSMAVLLSLLLPAVESAVARRRGRGRLGRVRGPARRQPAPRRGRYQPRRGRTQEHPPPHPAAHPAAQMAMAGAGAGADGEGEEEIPTWCNPKDPMGAFLLFKGIKVDCVNRGYEDFGPYGGV